MVITGLTRNQLCLRAPWVRIPPSPPKKETPKRAFQSVEKPEIQENWISGFTCFIIKVAKHKNAEEKIS